MALSRWLPPVLAAAVLACSPSTNAATSGPCVPDATTLCLDGTPGDLRFRVRVGWATAQGGGASGEAHALSTAPVGVTSGGLFWFFSAANPEVLVKVLDGCAVNGHRWVFTSAGTNVGLTIRVTDTETGAERVYVNPDLTPAAPVQDVTALGCTDPCAGPEQVTATITAPSTVAPLSGGNAASVAAQAGAAYAWTIANGTITGGAGTSAISFAAGASGTVELACTVTRSGCAASGTRSVGIGSFAVTLTPSPGASVPAGTPVTFTAAAAGEGPFEYRFLRGESAGTLRVVRDFAAGSAFTVTSNDGGSYAMRAEARVAGSAATASSPVVTQAVTFSGASPTLTLAPEHPLVARYVAPASACAGDGLRVEHRPSGSAEPWVTTPLRPCTGNAMGFLVAGMRPSTTYDVRHVTQGSASAPLEVTTGPLPPGLVVPPTVVTAGPSGASAAERVLFLSSFPKDGKPLPHAVDLSGQLVWFDPTWNDAVRVSTTFTPEGTLLLLVADQGFQGQLLREIDVAGGTVREVSIGRMREQVPVPADEVLGAFDHEAIRFPNGHTLVQVSHEKLLRNGPGPGDDVNVLGTTVVALDAGWQVVWSWNAFDHLDVAREATTQPAICANDTSGTGLPGCPPVFLPLEKPADLRVAEDWIHGNALAYSPADGNLTYSLRMQDWVLKIRYEDGAGDGALLWKLGTDGSFTTSSSDPSPWPSHQHGAVFVDGTTMSVFDNGNVRCEGQAGCKSRGQVWTLSESATPKTASLLLNVPLGYSLALGASQRLSNGSFHYTSGAQLSSDQPPQLFTESVEVTPQGGVALVLRTSASCYRTYRMPSLYGHSLTGGLRGATR